MTAAPDYAEHLQPEVPALAAVPPVVPVVPAVRPRTCRVCGDPARLYPAGWLCEPHKPGIQTPPLRSVS